jgi:hypothetical protein
MRLRRSLPWQDRVAESALWLCPTRAAIGRLERDTTGPVRNWAWELPRPRRRREPPRGR